MDLPTFERLLGETGRAALAAATQLRPTEAAFARHLEQLERHYERELARAALETVLLRERARAKFARADVMFFTRPALEQASGEMVARHRARRFEPAAVVGDFCCGIGGDTLALAGRGPVAAIDSDPLRLAMARANADACGLSAAIQWQLGDLRTMPLPPVAAAFLDPDRRAGGRRHVSLRHYQPPPEEIRARLPADFALGVKVAPAVPWNDIGALDAESEFISLGGELKECVLWFGPLRTRRRRATVLPAGATLAADEPATSRIGPVDAYLYDPDPAVTRAGLVANLGDQLDAHQIDSELAFLSGQRLAPTPLARAYTIEAALPFHAGRLRDWLRARGVGRLTIVKRGSAVDAEALRRQLKLAGDGARVIILTRVAGRPHALVGSPAGGLAGPDLAAALPAAGPAGAD